MSAQAANSALIITFFSAAVAQLNLGKEKMLWQSYQTKRGHVAFKANIFFVRCWRPKTAERRVKTLI